MGILRTIGIAFLAFLILIVGVPVLLFIMGLTAPLWEGIYNMALNTLGPNNPLTWIVYGIYQVAQLSNQYLVHLGSNGGVSK